MDLVLAAEELFYFLPTESIIFTYIVSSLEYVHFYYNSALITPEYLQLFRFVQIKKRKNKTEQETRFFETSIHVVSFKINPPIYCK